MPPKRSKGKTRFQLDYTKSSKEPLGIDSGEDINTDEHDDLDIDEPVKSRAQIKRELDQLLKQVEEISELPEKEFITLPLSDKERLGFEELKRIKSLNAQQRQRRFIAKQLRGRDHQEVIETLSEIKADRHALTQVFHQIEAIRDKLIDPELDHNAQQITLNEVFQRFPFADRQQLLQQIRKAKSNRGTSNEGKKLFKALRLLFEKEQQLARSRD